MGLIFIELASTHIGYSTSHKIRHTWRGVDGVDVHMVVDIFILLRYPVLDVTNPDTCGTIAF